MCLVNSYEFLVFYTFHVLKECSYQFVYSINKCFRHSGIEIAKYLIESLIIKQCGKIYLYLIFYRLGEWTFRSISNYSHTTSIDRYFYLLFRCALIGWIMIDCLKLGRVSYNQLQLIKWISCHAAGQGSFYLLNRSACSETNDQAKPLRKFAYRAYLM